jgi:hypothetical protein
MALNHNIDVISQIALPENMISRSVCFHPTQICDFLNVIFLEPLEKFTAFKEMLNL